MHLWNLEKTLITIDTFIDIPLLICALSSFILLFLLFIIKIKRTSKVSIVFFIALAIILAGSFYCYYEEHYIYFVFAIISAQIISLPYLIFKAFDNPKKREAKKAAKKEEQPATTQLEKTTLGDIQSLSDLKDQLKEEENK